MDEHVNISQRPVTLASGQPLGPGEKGPADPKDPNDAGLIEAGLIAKAIEPADYDARTAEDLQGEADSRYLTVEGTGKDGNVLKADLVSALKADDEKGAH